MILKTICLIKKAIFNGGSIMKRMLITMLMLAAAHANIFAMDINTAKLNVNKVKRTFENINKEILTVEKSLGNQEQINTRFKATRIMNAH